MCPSCGTEFGVDDVDQSFSEIRGQWLDAGAPWWSTVIPPPSNWNPINQINELQKELAAANRPFKQPPETVFRELNFARIVRRPPDVTRFLSPKFARLRMAEIAS